MLHSFLNLPAPLLAVCAGLIAGALYALGLCTGKLHRELDRRRTERQILEIQTSIDRQDAMMAQAERDYAARMGLTQGEYNA
ncbi:hypothetical protein GGQ73_003052 [Rhizobium skierniewicense]|uniref:LapA family protein n=1 Tax=Rhizobium skierniewicense TaxID=984260 RepID=A0A7W6G2H3_9HYPH|nr:hypothetical protein [Rhizobium skierniewicense]MBB3947088.1 hypothetical protein [Rhizobium skierniewicense]